VAKAVFDSKQNKIQINTKEHLSYPCKAWMENHTLHGFPPMKTWKATGRNWITKECIIIPTATV
jgi:hypothetical protein